MSNGALRYGLPIVMLVTACGMSYYFGGVGALAGFFAGVFAGMPLAFGMVEKGAVK